MAYKHTLYNAKRGPHTVYRLEDGTEVPGTTKILGTVGSSHLIEWANNIGLEGIEYKKYMKRASYIGSEVHNRIEHFLLTGERVFTVAEDVSDDIRDEILMAFKSFLLWHSKNNVEVLYTEFQAVSEEYHFGGTMDLVCRIKKNGKWLNYIIDFKTSKYYDQKFFCQLYAYKQLLRENKPDIVIDKVAVLKLNKFKPSVSFRDDYNLDEELYFEKFLAAKDIVSISDRMEETWDWQYQTENFFNKYIDRALGVGDGANDII